MRTTRASRLAGIVAVLAMIAACGADGNAGGSDGDGSGTPLRLALHWTYPVGEWDGIILADHLGYYEEAGVDVQLQYLAGSTATVQAVGGGKSDLALAGADSILSGLTVGVDATAVANHLQVTSSGVIVPSDSGITGAKDLAGKKISTASASPEQAMLQAMLQDGGLDIKKDVKLTYVDPQAKCTVLLSGDADACTGQVNHHPIQLAGEGLDVDFLSFSSDENPVIGHSIIARNEYLKEQPEAVRAFLEATMRGYKEAYMDVDKVVDVYKEVHPETDADFLRKTVVPSHALMYSQRTDEHGWGWMTDQAWARLYENLYDAGVIKEELKVSDVYTNDFLPKNAWKPKPKG